MFLDERDRGRDRTDKGEILTITIDLSTYFRGTEHSERNIGIQTTLLGNGVDGIARERMREGKREASNAEKGAEENRE